MREDDDERRSETRRRLMVGAELADEKGTLAVGELVDLSANGAQVTLMARYDEGSRLKIELDPAVAGIALRFEGYVQWCQPSPAGFSYGLSLLDTPPEVRSEIEALVYARDEEREGATGD